MGRDVTQERQQAHDLLDALPAEKLTAVVHLLRAIGDPVAPNLANAPLDDEPISEEETSAAETSRNGSSTTNQFPTMKCSPSWALLPKISSAWAAPLPMPTARDSKDEKEGRLGRTGQSRSSSHRSSYRTSHSARSGSLSRHGRRRRQAPARCRTARMAPASWRLARPLS